MKKFLLSLTIAGLGLTVNTEAQTIYSQDFESCTVPALPTGYTNVHIGYGGMGWQTNSGAINMVSSGSTYATIPAHTIFAVVNDGDIPANYPAKTTTPAFSLAGTSNVYLSYDACFLGFEVSATARAEKAWVDFSTDGGVTFTTIDTIAATTGWATRYVQLTGSTATCKLRFVYTDNRTSATDTIGIVGVGIDNIKVYTPPVNSIELTNATPLAGDPSADFAINGGNITFGGTVFNLGSSTITSFTASYKVGTSAAVNTSVTGVSIAPFTSYTFTCTPAYTITSMGTQTSEVYVTLTGDTMHSDDTLHNAVNGVNSFPKKRPFFEEPTGTWCGFCVRGIVYMDSIWNEHFSDISLVSVHNQNLSVGRVDGMEPENSTTVAYDNYCASKIGGFPGLIVDRIFVTPNGADDAFTYYNTLSTWYGFATMGIHVTTAGSSLTTTVTVQPTMNLSGDYRLELIITEDKVHGTTTAFDQHNYYNGGGYGALGGQGVNYVTAPNPIPAAQMYYRFVDRYTVPDVSVSANGVASSLPSTMTSGTVYTYSFSPVTIASDWVTNNLRVIALLIDNNPTSNTYNMVLNSINTVGTLGLSNVTAGIDGVRTYPNPAREQANVLFNLNDASDISVTVYDVAGRVVYSVPATSMTSGNQMVTVPVSNFTDGIYNVVIGNDKGFVTDRFTVVR